MTKVIFNKLHVDAEQITGHNLTDGFRGLIEAGTPGHTTHRHSPTTDSNEDGGPFPKEGTAITRLTDTDLLDVILSDHGSSKTAMVDH